MSIKLNCPHCNQKLEADESLLGKDLECQSCNNSFTVSDSAETPDPTIEKKKITPDEIYHSVISPFIHTTTSKIKAIVRTATPKIKAIIHTVTPKIKAVILLGKKKYHESKKVRISVISISIFIIIIIIIRSCTGANPPIIYNEWSEETIEAAKQGDAEAQYVLATGTSSSSKDKFAWLSKAAEQGHAKAQCILGYCYEDGDEVTKDIKEAVKWFHKAAEQGNTDAQWTLGRRYQHGDGVKKNIKESIKWYSLSGRGNINIGRIYISGDGVDIDYTEGLKWLRKGKANIDEIEKIEKLSKKEKIAKKGDAKAQYEFGCLCEKLNVNPKEAILWYRRAAEQGYVKAQIKLAEHFRYSNEEEAVKWYIKAAEQGYPQAQYELGERYEYGKGVIKNYKKAIEWFSKAYAQGYRKEKTNSNIEWLSEEIKKAIAYKVRRANKAKEKARYQKEKARKAKAKALAEAKKTEIIEKAREAKRKADEKTRKENEHYKQLCKAAEQGDANVQAELGSCYNLGIGVDRDYKKAINWWSKAVKQGHVGAKSKLSAAEFKQEYRSPSFNPPPQGTYYAIPDLGIKIVYVSPGSFQMGSNGKRKSGLHVTISKGYWIGKHEVTWREYDYSNSSMPCEIDWISAVEFCKQLTIREHAAGRLQSDCEYRLPTEAEFEFAARGGTKSLGSKYSGSNNIDNVAFKGQHKRYESGTKSPNELGIYGMSGNALEWCGDNYDVNKHNMNISKSVTDPKGKVVGRLRIVRGGDRETVYDRTGANSGFGQGFRILRTVTKKKEDGQTHNEPEQYKQYLKAAKQGNIKAQTELGICYYSGIGIDRNYLKAVKWFRKAAKQGDAKAQDKLGDCYFYEIGVLEDYKKATEWWFKAANQGYAEAQYKLGICHLSNEAHRYGVMEDKAEMEKWLLKAARQGHAKAQYKLAETYDERISNKKGIKKAIKWYRKVAEQGNIEAQRRLAELCFNDLKDYKEAVKWWRKAAEQGNQYAQLALGDCYQNGVGVKRNYIKAANWYSKAKCRLWKETVTRMKKLSKYYKAAKTGNAKAQTEMGDCYYEEHRIPVSKGEYVETRNYLKAKEWWLKAANQGYTDAQAKLGECYSSGSGENNNSIEAAKWWHKAAEQGHAKAQYKLGKCYQGGRGVTKDYKKMLKWYRKAAAQGQIDAKAALKQISGQ